MSLNDHNVIEGLVLQGETLQSESEQMRVEAARKLRLSMRLRVLALYGGMCLCCGETTVEFLQLDHIYNNGAEHRRYLGISAGAPFYTWVLANGRLPGLQILCSNCHSAKSNYGSCPHQAEAEGERRSALGMEPLTAFAKLACDLFSRFMLMPRDEARVLARDAATRMQRWLA